MVNVRNAVQNFALHQEHEKRSDSQYNEIGESSHQGLKPIFPIASISLFPPHPPSPHHLPHHFNFLRGTSAMKQIGVVVTL